MQLSEYADRDEVASTLAQIMANSLKSALANHSKVSLVVPGGTTPGPIFDRLSAADLDWDRVSVLLSDERWVPDDHERSNARLVRERLLQGPASSATFLPYYRDGLTAHEAAPVLSKEFEQHFPITVLLLGMGADMHTASLFPGANGLDAALAPDALAVCAIDTDSQPEPRITLSARVLNAAREKHLVIFGDDKKAALENAVGLPLEQAPIAAVITEGTVHWAK